MPFLICRFLAGAGGDSCAPAKGGNATAAKAEVFKNCRRVVKSFSVAMATSETRLPSKVNKKQDRLFSRPR
jgi:hypothetical protein